MVEKNFFGTIVFEYGIKCYFCAKIRYTEGESKTVKETLLKQRNLCIGH
jgi:hypothetical protein